jgi:histidine triad (HIT) family protein
MGTIFSRILSGEIPCYKITENDKFFAFLDVFPLVNGHVLVVPKLETDYIFDIEDQELSEMIVFAKNVSRAIKKSIPCKRIGVAVIGLEVPHAHIHLVPLNSVSDINFEKPKLKPSAQELATVAELIKNNL